MTTVLFLRGFDWTPIEERHLTVARTIAYRAGVADVSDDCAAAAIACGAAEPIEPASEAITDEETGEEPAEVTDGDL